MLSVLGSVNPVNVATGYIVVYCAINCVIPGKQLLSPTDVKFQFISLLKKFTTTFGYCCSYSVRVPLAIVLSRFAATESFTPALSLYDLSLLLSLVPKCYLKTSFNRFLRITVILYFLIDVYIQFLWNFRFPVRPVSLLHYRERFKVDLELFTRPHIQIIFKNKRVEYTPTFFYCDSQISNNLLIVNLFQVIFYRLPLLKTKFVWNTDWVLQGTISNRTEKRPLLIL